MLYIDLKYISQLSTKLRNFKQKNTHTFNFSCPFCGDSQKHKTKARGYCYPSKNDLFYKCHNCGVSTNVGNLIKHVDPYLYEQYVVERYQLGINKHKSHKKIEYPETKPSFSDVKDDILDGLRRVDLLPDLHPAKLYVESRLIPKEKYSLLFYCAKWKKYVNRIKYTYALDEENDHPRLVIPFYNKKKEIFAIQGRAFGKEIPRYMTIKLDEDAEKIYGLERTDVNNKIYAVEGPIDSLFLPNCIAVAGASFGSQYLKSFLNKIVVVFDNEPRNKELCKQIEKCIDDGYAVSLIPETGHKDINDLVKAGWNKQEIIDLIDKNTSNGLEAKVKFNQWKKI